MTPPTSCVYVLACSLARLSFVKILCSLGLVWTRLGKGGAVFVLYQSKYRAGFNFTVHKSSKLTQIIAR